MRKWVAVVLLAALVGCAWKSPTLEQLAMQTCSEVLRMAAKNPTSAEIPAPEAVVSETGILLEWGHGAGLRFMNNMGAMLDTHATCALEVDGVTLKWVSVDGERVFESPEVRAERVALEARLMEEDIKRRLGSSPESAEETARAAMMVSLKAADDAADAAEAAAGSAVP